ncbi:MAG: phenylalanine--tRNA ligase subunit beta [Candidatus Ratteibacteria bacterium]
MRYTYKTIMNYIDGEIKKEDFINYLNILGLNPKIIKKDEEDIIFELEIPANRPDLLSFIGIAREIIPFCKKKLKEFKKEEIEESSDFFPIEIENENDCFYYSCRIIKNVNNKSSPEEFRKLLENINFRSSFFIVDISNFVMCEIGQPLHIFDLDKIKEKIIIRRGRKGEKIITIDGEERDVEDVLIIADKEKPIAIAGIMGGKNTEVTYNTKNILIESAYFNPIVIRKGSKKIGLVTEASLRFEKGLSVSLAKNGLERATIMIKKYCGGEVGKQNFAGKQTISENKIHVNLGNIEKTLGIKIEKEFVKNLFNRDDFSIHELDNDNLILKIPEYRKDLKEEIDIIEEVAKYKKYSEIPSEMPVTYLKPFSLTSDYEVIKKIKNVLVNLGFWETISLSFISDKVVERFNLDAIKIENPLTKSFSYLRNSLIFNLFEILKYNISHQNKKIEIFELGKIYIKEANNYRELNSIMLISSNSNNLFDFKGKVECFFEKCGLSELRYVKNDYFLAESGSNCDIYFSDEKIGNLFIPLNELKDFYKINDEVYICEILVNKLLKYLNFDKKFKQLPKFPSSKKDFSFLFSENINWKEVENTIKKLDLPIDKLEAFDIYKGKNIPSGKISVSFSIVFRSSEKTLEKDEIDRFEKIIIETIENKFNAILRGKNV